MVIDHRTVRHRMGTKQASQIVWFRNDLRISDHQALDKALENCQPGQEVKALYVYDSEEQEWGHYQVGWLKRSLHALEISLQTLGVKLWVRHGDTTTEVLQFCQEHTAEGIYWHRRYLPKQQTLDKKIKEALNSITCESFSGYLCLEPWHILNKSGLPFKVFTPYWKTLQTKVHVEDFYLNKSHQLASKAHQSKPMQNTCMLEGIPDTWTDELKEKWEPGEVGAQNKLKNFIENWVQKYHISRDRPDWEGTSELSPHLRFGEVSPHRVWADVCANHLGEGVQVFLSELAWRDFGYYVIHHFPSVMDRSFKPAFDHMPWVYDVDKLTSWQQGQTGYPLVDAGMRQLQQTGWMHNRIRMLVASFLTKHLLMDWRHGLAWFKDYLLDHDPASNLSGWQWSAGCGVDAQPYFRIFNPTRQAEKFDPEGDYIEKYVPELKAIPGKLRKEPWSEPGVMRVGQVNYPQPIVEHKESRERALAALKSIQKSSE